MNKMMMILGMILVTAIVLSTGFTPSAAGQDDMKNLISVSGTAKVSVEPDMAKVSFGVQTEHQDSSVAQDQNTERMNQVIAAVKKLGIAKKDMVTTQYNVYPRHDYDNNGKITRTYYIVNHQLQVVVNDINQVGMLIKSASDAGANQFSDIQFMISNEEEVYQEMLEKAVKNAKGKASAIARGLGKTLGQAVSVSEQSSGGVRTYAAAVGMELAKTSPSAPIQGGEISISASVQVEYQY